MRKELTAYHEAGHAVMALLMGRSVQKVSIIPSQNRLGAVTIQKGRSKQVQDKLEAEMLILLAGMAAEGRISGQYNLYPKHCYMPIERPIYETKTMSENLLETVHKLKIKTGNNPAAMQHHLRTCQEFSKVN